MPLERVVSVVDSFFKALVSFSFLLIKLHTRTQTPDDDEGGCDDYDDDADENDDDATESNALDPGNRRGGGGGGGTIIKFDTKKINGRERET